MSRRVLVAPAHLRAIEPVYAPILRDAGYTVQFSPHNTPGTEQQMSEADLLEHLPGCVASLAGSEPYTPAVIIDQFEEPAEPGGLTRIFASILVDSASQKPIVVGKGGDMIKRIGTEARMDLEEMLGGKVFLDLHVKVREDWRDDERILNEIGLGKSRE